MKDEGTSYTPCCKCVPIPREEQTPPCSRLQSCFGAVALHMLLSLPPPPGGGRKGMVTISDHSIARFLWQHAALGGVLETPSLLAVVFLSLLGTLSICRLPSRGAESKPVDGAFLYNLPARINVPLHRHLCLHAFHPSWVTTLCTSAYGGF